jgi:hypothetical protein
VIITFFLRILRRLSREKFSGHTRGLVFSLAGIFVVMNILYFTNIIPPLPLSLKDSGIYHSLVHNPSGGYSVEVEPESWWSKYFTLYPDFHLPPGEVVYAYSSVFSPESFSLVVIHEWQYEDSKTEDWITAGSVALPIVGGRSGGYMTYSMRVGLLPGHWRVNVLTPTGLVLGTLRFNVVATNTEPVLKTELIQ